MVAAQNAPGFRLVWFDSEGLKNTYKTLNLLPFAPERGPEHANTVRRLLHFAGL